MTKPGPTTATKNSLDRDRHLRRAFLAVVALTSGLWAWTSGFSGPYHFDDNVTPLNDPASQSLAAWRDYLPVTLRPVSKLSYALEAEAGWSREPAPRRALSLLLHTVSAGLLLLLIARLAPGTAPPGAALLAALWFIHPVHADAVLMLSGRTAVLAGLFLLAALLALERGRRWPAGLLFVLACLSRETALAGLLPLAVLAASRPGASLRSTLRELGPALLGGALVLAWILATPRYLHLAEFSFLGRPFWSSVAAQVGAVPVGLGLLFNPAALSIDYGIPLPTRIADPLALLGLALYLAAAAGVLLHLRRNRAVAVGLALWLAALLPTQSVVPKLDALTNRPLSLALAGILLALSPLLARAIKRVRPARANTHAAGAHRALPARGHLVAACCGLALFLLLSAATAGRGKLFQSELSLWQDAAGKSRSNARPHVQLALMLHSAGRDAEARQVLAEAARIDPFSSDIALFSKLTRDDEVVP
ncbi:MAG: hypothetical protein MUE63_03295 [Xanthomonadales bacterium]|jgi:hypothetical protein|nr:hypothetical protein [Xanthomonadales bacterium]